MFVKNCGAAAPFALHVYLGPVGDKDFEMGNVYRGEHSNKGSIRWENNNRLIITSEAETILLMKNYFGVEFSVENPVNGVKVH